jgi:uncharacterized OB-fold protein
MSPPCGPERQYLDKLAAGRFEIQRCAGCGKHVFYPRVLCPHCGGERLDWVAPSGRGTVYSTTIVRRKPADGGDYNVCLVDPPKARVCSAESSLFHLTVKIYMAVAARIADGLVEFTPG